MSTVPGGQDDWAARITAKVEQGVSIVRDHTVRPVQRAVRVVIYGLAAVGSLFVVGALVAIGVLRLLDTELFHQRVWASYLVLGGIFVAAGLLVSSMRHSRS